MSSKLWLNGEAATLADVAHLALLPYGHFTSMHVAAGCVRGLHLHLQRLDRGSRLLFGHGLPPEDVRALLRAALAGSTDPCAVRITVYSRALTLDHPEGRLAPDVLIRVTPAAIRPPAPPLSLNVLPYEREMPAVKHVATLGLLYHRRQARASGFDDALFVNRAGEISEASVWNIGFIDAEGDIVWPDALRLPGVTMDLLQTGLRQAGWSQRCAPVLRADLGQFRGAFLCNAREAVQPVARIDHHQYGVDAGRLQRLRDCWEAQPAERI